MEKKEGNTLEEENWLEDMICRFTEENEEEIGIEGVPQLRFPSGIEEAEFPTGAKTISSL